MMWNRKKKAKIKELRAIEEQASRQLQNQRPEVHHVASWLSRRKDENGFGLDFEYTLRPRSAK